MDTVSLQYDSSWPSMSLMTLSEWVCSIFKIDPRDEGLAWVAGRWKYKQSFRMSELFFVIYTKQAAVGGQQL